MNFSRQIVQTTRFDKSKCQGYEYLKLIRKLTPIYSEQFEIRPCAALNASTVWLPICRPSKTGIKFLSGTAE